MTDFVEFHPPKAGSPRQVTFGLASLMLVALTGGCTEETNAASPVERDWPCELTAGTAPDAAPDYLTKIGCADDFQALASQPLDASIPGARSGKVVMDLDRGDQLYFQNSQRYAIHYEFVTNSTGKLDQRLFTGTLNDFNPNYTLPENQRHFLLGAVTYYEEPKVWALELAPYDTATPQMIEKLYRAVQAQAFYGPVLTFHPTSESIETTAKSLPSSVRVSTTEQLYAAIDYQPLNLGVAVGTLKIIKAADLANEYVSARDIVVLDEVPNDISPVAAIVTEQFQTPLSHINVLARNRGTANMGLRGATTRADFQALEGKQARLAVGAFGWELAPATLAEADAWWEAHKPPPVTPPPLNLEVKELRDIALVTEHTDSPPYVTKDAIKAAIQAFGAKAANYSVFHTDPLVPNKPGFAIPVYYYHEFMVQNGIFDQITTLRADPEFLSNDQYRDVKLAELRDQIRAGVFSDEFQALLKAKLDQDFPGRSMRFRSSTNAEDLDGFACAGCYDSHTGDPALYGGDQLAACLQAIRKTWATAWTLRTYNERELHEIDHAAIAMGLLVHTNFPNEEANGVAVTNNIFDATGNAPGFYVNVQFGGDFEVVSPPAGVTSDSFLYQFSFPNQPVIYYSHSNIIPEGTHVLTDRQIYDLGVALDAIHKRFANVYQSSPTAWYAMDTEFKFDDDANPGQPATLYIKQARPYAANSGLATSD